jgi:hypothetical protein
VSHCNRQSCERIEAHLLPRRCVNTSICMWPESRTSSHRPSTSSGKSRLPETPRPRCNRGHAAGARRVTVTRKRRTIGRQGRPRAMVMKESQASMTRARAAVVYLRAYENTENARAAIRHRTSRIRVSMEQGDGEFVNFRRRAGRSESVAPSSQKACPTGLRGVCGHSAKRYACSDRAIRSSRALRPVIDRTLRALAGKSRRGRLIGRIRNRDCRSASWASRARAS